MWLVVGLGNPGAKYERNRHNIGFLAVDALAGKAGVAGWARKFSGEIAEGKLPVARCPLPALVHGPRKPPPAGGRAGEGGQEVRHHPLPGTPLCPPASGGRSPWGGKNFVSHATTPPLPEIQATRNPQPATKLHFLKPQTFMNLSGEAVAAAARFYKIPPDHIIVLHDELDLLPGKLRVKQGGGTGGHNGLKSIDAHIGDGYWRVRIGIGHPGAAHEVLHYVLGDFSRAEWEMQEKMLAAITDAFGLMLAGDDAGFMNKVALTLAPPRPPKPPKKETDA